MIIGDPFIGNVPKKISKEELIQAIRVDIAGELEAITVYDAHAMATDDPRAKDILYSIRDEERQHVGELLHLLEILDPAESQFLAKGKQEVDQLLTQKGHAQQNMQAGQSQHQAMQAGGQGGSQQMMPPQSLPGQEGLGQYPSFTYQPRPGNFGHRGPNSW